MSCRRTSESFIGGRKSRRNRIRTKTRRSGKSHKKKGHRGGSCGSCQPQKGGNALLKAIVPATFLATLFGTTRKKRGTKHRRGTHRSYRKKTSRRR